MFRVRPLIIIIRRIIAIIRIRTTAAGRQYRFRLDIVVVGAVAIMAGAAGMVAGAGMADTGKGVGDSGVLAKMVIRRSRSCARIG